ncbi:heme peroxidase [Mycena belliarum]|uniref:Peroxidase n=1 Tax=Mycena belliarum TaxID=1033014 RepID=A0AAD6U0J0_9AGAR|nr:heme peroxidase [Mycena belliae]
MFTLGFLALAGTAAAYVWPSPQLDALEAERWDQDDKFSGLRGFIKPCDFYTFGDGTGRANTADWIRTAYHDMATHNVEDGTGGLDASIRFAEELARGENPGNGFQNTMDVFISAATRYVSMADLVALGLITSVESCGGPEIPFRGGRIDAEKPNTPGVPEPSQDVQSHIASFARQGFTQAEMIGLVACGHTFGGVQHEQFPNTVPQLNDSNNTLSVQHFDSTFGHFDNNVATEYISGTTTNPLVAGANDTTNSDKRIFASDGNVTMKSFADSAEVFASTCGSLLARMLDTVPRGVNLTEVIQPVPVKPTQVTLVLDGDSLKLSGLVRLFNQSEDPSRSVGLTYENHAGKTSDVIPLQADHQSTTMGGRIRSSWYSFNGTESGTLSLDAAAGITRLGFTVNGKVEDQGGVGFAVQDGFMFAASTCSHPGFPLKGRFDVAVRNGFNVTRLYLGKEARDAVDRVIVRELDIALSAQVPAGKSYVVHSIDIQDGDNYFIGAEVDGKKLSTVEKRSLWNVDTCVSTPQRRAHPRTRGQ